MSETYAGSYWTEEAGERWAQTHSHLDALLAPFAEALVEHANIERGHRLADVGCGAGATTLRAARRAGAGSTIGVDISPPLLKLARELAAAEAADVEYVKYVEADAATWTPPAPVDRVLSRFGIMFFDAPVDAFRNLRSWLSPGGELAALVWQSRERNPWLAEPLALVAPEDQWPSAEPGAPGPYSLGDEGHTRAVLSAAGFDDVELEDLSVEMFLAGDRDVAAAMYLEWGPTARYYQEADEAERPRMAERIHDFVERHHDGDGMRFVGRVWAIRAR
jgi:ubiquinone/menaquinone biosynthesis C-methylase UbiE